MSPCHNLEPSLVARDSSRLLSVKPNEWMHLSPFYTRMHGEWLRYAKSTSQFHWRFLLVRDVRGFQVNPLCCHDITSPFPPSGNGGYVRNLDVSCACAKSFLLLLLFCLFLYKCHFRGSIIRIIAWSVNRFNMQIIPQVCVSLTWTWLVLHEPVWKSQECRI